MVYLKYGVILGMIILVWFLKFLVLLFIIGLIVFFFGVLSVLYFINN